MEKQEYILKPSLQQMALRKVAILLWTEADILNLINRFEYRSRMDEFLTKEWNSLVGNKVRNKVSSLGLPETIKKKLLHTIEPIGPEILKWKIGHSAMFSDVGDALDQICWTSVGTVDYRETARTLIRQEQINIYSRYCMACLYCLDDDIPSIWEKLPEDSKKKFLVDENHSYLSFIWSHIHLGIEDKLNHILNRNSPHRTLYQHIFVSVAESGNTAATRYFFQKLSSEERKASLPDAANALVRNATNSCNISIDFPKGKFCDTLCFLLSQMDKEEQMKVFEKNAFTCLRCFLDWPWQNLFMKVAELSWPFLRKREYSILIMILIFSSSIFGCNFKKLFRELFYHASTDFREHLMDEHWHSGLWFRYLFYSQNIESIKLVLRVSDSSQKQRFIMCDGGLALCCKLIRDGRWFLLELFIAECVLSEEAKAKLKDDFKEYSGYTAKCDPCERFFKLVDTANIEDFSKRSLEDMENEEHDGKRRRYELKIV